MESVVVIISVENGTLKVKGTGPFFEQLGAIEAARGIFKYKVLDGYPSKSEPKKPPDTVADPTHS